VGYGCGWVVVSGVGVVGGGLGVGLGWWGGVGGVWWGVQLVGCVVGLLSVDGGCWVGFGGVLGWGGGLWWGLLGWGVGGWGVLVVVVGVLVGGGLWWGGFGWVGFWVCWGSVGVVSGGGGVGGWCRFWWWVVWGGVWVGRPPTLPHLDRGGRTNCGDRECRLTILTLPRINLPARVTVPNSMGPDHFG